MKYRALAPYAAVAFLAALIPTSISMARGDEPKKSPEQQELEALRQKTDALALELAETKKTLETAVTYLEAQADAASAMEAVLDDAEKKGFAVGENWGSRAALLAGWREQIAAAKKDVPKMAPPPKPAEPEPKPRPRRN